jgi:hypothetical protein
VGWRGDAGEADHAQRGHSGGGQEVTRLHGQLVEIIDRLAGQPKAKVRSTPVLLLRAIGVVNPTVRELVELQYEFQEPFIVDSSKITAKFDLHATPTEQALADHRRQLPRQAWLSSAA